MGALLKIQDLKVGPASDESKQILRHVDFEVKEGEMLALVGESGCGKSMTALSVMGLLPQNLKIHSGKIEFEGINIAEIGTKKLNELRGKDIAMIFQDPLTSLNPSFTIGNQLAEVFKYHTDYDKETIRKKSIEVLESVKIPDAEEKLKAYPHELSGGMRQRVMIAMALACNPKILIADEPTTALDVTIQAQILDLITELQSKNNMSIIMITHDLGVVAETCKRAIVMYAGQIVEEGSVEDIFDKPLHPYTEGLMLSAPRLGNPKEKLHVIEGTVPSIDNMPKGCSFSPRCKYATSQCFEEKPELEEVSAGRRVRCWNRLL